MVDNLFAIYNEFILANASESIEQFMNTSSLYPVALRDLETLNYLRYTEPTRNTKEAISEFQLFFAFVQGHIIQCKIAKS